MRMSQTANPGWEGPGFTKNNGSGRGSTWDYYTALLPEIKPLFPTFHSSEDAEAFIWNRIFDATADPKTAGRGTDRLMRHAPAYVAGLRAEREDRLLAVRHRRALRRAVGDAPVDVLKDRQREAKTAYREAIIAAMRVPPGKGRVALLDAALARWEKEADAIRAEHSKLIWRDTEVLSAPAPNRGEGDRKQAFRSPDRIDNMRNDTLFRLACSLYGKNLTQEAVEAAVRAENANKCYEPLPEDEVRVLLKSAKRTHEKGLEQKPEVPCGGTPETRIKLIRAGGIAPEPIRWVWRGWLAAGKLHILAGAPGTGKSTLAFGLAASISTGGRWPDGSPAEPGDVVIWSGEDDPADTIVPRLMACGADRNRIHILTGVEGADPRPFDPATDMAALRLALGGLDIRLLIVDPIVSAVSGDSHKNTEVRRALQPLVDLGAACDCAVLGISHFSKGTAGRDPIERVTGSLAFGALARVVLAAAKLPEDEHNGARLLARAKSNIGPDSGGVLYHLEQVAIPGHPDIINTRVLWGAPVEGSARDLLAEAEEKIAEKKTAVDEAREWLAVLLKEGPMKAGDIQKEAGEAGISKRSLYAAKEQLKIVNRKNGYDGTWWWRLPEKEGSEGDEPPGFDF